MYISLLFSSTVKKKPFKWPIIMNRGKEIGKQKIHRKYIDGENIKAFSSHMGICKTRNKCYKT